MEFFVACLATSTVLISVSVDAISVVMLVIASPSWVTLHCASGKNNIITFILFITQKGRSAYLLPLFTYRKFLFLEKCYRLFIRGS